MTPDWLICPNGFSPEAWVYCCDGHPSYETFLANPGDIARCRAWQNGRCTLCSLARYPQDGV